jgi:NAD(P)-dependent dehydrogenase (short-subunit alcohol dehydrogenase family)
MAQNRRLYRPNSREVPLSGDDRSQEAFPLTQRTSHVLVTGGAGDIGRAIGRRLAADGNHVTLLDLLDPEAGRQAAEQTAAAAGVAAEYVAYAHADVTDRAAVDRVIADLPRLDIAIANAGVAQSAPVLEITEQQWQNHLSVNLTGAFHTAQSAARRMVADGSPGLLLFTGSWIGSVPWPEMTAYSTTKAGLEMLARQFARELAGRRIRANVVAPGIVRAGLAKHQLETEPQYAARAARVVPLGELQTADQVADAVGVLCSPAGSYMTGSTFLVDGGCSLFAFD